MLPKLCCMHLAAQQPSCSPACKLQLIASVLQAAWTVSESSQELGLKLLSMTNGLSSIITWLSSSALEWQQIAAGAIWSLSSNEGNVGEGHMEQLVSSLPSLIACCSSDNKLLQENALGALSNLAAYKAIQSKLIELQGHLVMLTMLEAGSASLQGHCARGLGALAKSQDSGLCFMTPAALNHLVTLLSTPDINAQLSSLSILGSAFSSWVSAPSATQANAVGHFIKIRGMQALVSHLHSPFMQEHAASCISSLAKLEPSWPAFASSGLLLQLVEKMSYSVECHESPSTAISAAITQRHAVEAIARLVANIDLAAMALHFGAPQVLIQLIHSPSSIVWAAAVQAMALLTDTQVGREAFHLEAEDMRAIAVDSVAVSSQDTACQLAHLFSNLAQGAVMTPMRALECLTWMLDLQSEAVRTEAAQAVCALARKDPDVRGICARGSIFRQLAQMLQSSNKQVQIAATNALHSVARPSWPSSFRSIAGNEEAIANCLHCLVEQLSSSILELRVKSVQVLENICHYDDDIHKQISEMNVLPPLAAMLSADDPSEVQAAKDWMESLAQHRKQQNEAL